MIQIYSIWEKYFYISVYQSSKLVFIRFILLMNENSSSWGQTMKTTNIKSESGKISLWEKLSYSGGDVASSITFGAVQFLPFLLLYRYRRNFHCSSGRDLWRDKIVGSTGEFPDGRCY